MIDSPAAGKGRARARDPRYQLWRGRKDRVARWVITGGGLAVFASMVAILLYLAWETAPLFSGADEDTVTLESGPDWRAADTRLLVLDERGQAGLRVGVGGAATFFSLPGFERLGRTPLASDAGRATAAAEDLESPGTFAVAFADGRAVVARYRFMMDFSDGVEAARSVGRLEFPHGEAPLALAPGAVTALAARDHPDGLLLAALSGGDLHIHQQSLQQNFLTGESQVESTTASVELPFEATTLALDGQRRWAYVGDSNGGIHRFSLPGLEESGVIRPGTRAITAMRMLLGGTSLLAGDAGGVIRQAFPVRENDTGPARLTVVREFAAHDNAIIDIHPEYRRRGFLSLDAGGELGVHYTTSDRTLMRRPLVEATPAVLALTPRADGVFSLGANGVARWTTLDNPHPEVSMGTLWSETWYENYPGPRHTWQSSAATNDFEPKFSLVPLVFGTLKAAIYAMLFAVPLALLGAAYTAVFMAPALRRRIKPMIEIMAALPTVILGFLAGLWLAPWLEAHLAGVFALAVVLPTGVLALAWGWHRAGLRRRLALPLGWEPLVLLPVLLVLGALALWLADPLQNLFFGGDLRTWLTLEGGVSYDQRNALVVGIAMGFAVVPTIFSIAEDALFAVPRSLSDGSLALGATRWQTLVKVVLPTASPGIFSGLMIGFGRAVGETMIVLMATGNTPITDWNLFEGMRTLAANIAVEMPESAVHSTHYRILFLSALVLFVFTFIVNTGAELVRQRLRARYSSL
ncbi:ABC transporter permease subunit [Marinihelvus fidelis]|uniref:ABC transporter permease subunit n=1 Tax=Marinihelvus fidelis TaxID=2613842 RepID=A0A5N0T4S7_9GAMM|nr:ABC transporter permease subunit [Marinihelvus fidelis]KAA9129862.1 ABC transporter permease subunit [Marinihelvus fidelis]